MKRSGIKGKIAGRWDRIQELLVEYGSPEKEFARVVGSDGLVFKIHHDNPTVSASVIDRIAWQLGTSVEWLNTGRGERVIEDERPPTLEERRLLAQLRRLPAQAQVMVQQSVTVILEANQAVEQETRKRRKKGLN
jgi:CTP:molybdopterin cytidylyltransferase MocA